MSNVRLHPYEGSEPSCLRCQLPKKNAVHKPSRTILVTATFTDDTTQEWWFTEHTKETLTKALDDLLVGSVVDDPVQPDWPVDDTPFQM